MSSEKLVGKPEADPNGLDPHSPGAKLDAGKPRPALVLGGFARALKAVTRVGTYGAMKYTDNGWVLVQNGIERYDDAKLRHWLDEKCGVECDRDTGIEHAAHEAWNALARLDLLIRQKEECPTRAVPGAADGEGLLRALQARERAMHNSHAAGGLFGPEGWKGGHL